VRKMNEIKDIRVEGETLVIEVRQNGFRKE
jgi:hypothetical protein